MKQASNRKKTKAAVCRFKVGMTTFTDPFADFARFPCGRSSTTRLRRGATTPHAILMIQSGALTPGKLSPIVGVGSGQILLTLRNITPAAPGMQQHENLTFTHRPIYFSSRISWDEGIQVGDGYSGVLVLAGMKSGEYGTPLNA